MAFSRYSLWLMPSGRLYQELSHLIARIAQEHSAPVFLPHVTLLGSIEADETEIIAAAQRVALLISPYTMQLTDIGYTDFFYRALFLRIEPSPGVLAAYQAASTVFPAHPEQEYMPHLSLLYGDFPVEMKQRIIQTIGTGLAGSFEASTLFLYQTAGSVENWRKTGEFSLH